MSRCIWFLPLLAACGASAATVRHAGEAHYDVPYATVWNVVTEEVHKRYVGIHIEDAVNGRIETDYRVVEALNQDVAQTSATATTSSVGVNAPSGASQIRSEAAIFRMTVQILGPPWKVSVDGMAAKYDPGMALPVPYKHGVIDEPPWVQSRIDNLTMAIYNRLKQYEIREENKPKIAEKVMDTTPWANLPDRAAVSVIGEVHKAAVDRNARALRPLMAADFEWAEGADTSPDTAIAVWSADPTALRALARTLDAGCAADQASGDVLCPTSQSPDTGKARFRQYGQSWKLVQFVR